jgi:hypothetical protein
VDHLRLDTITLERAQRERETGKGRRPSAAAIRALEKRQGLSWQSYDSALKRLQELAPPKGPRALTDAVKQAVAEANRR